MGSVGRRSATSIWSRSRDSRLSIEDQSSERRSRTPAGGVSARASTSLWTSGGKAGMKPFSAIALRAVARRSKSIERCSHENLELGGDPHHHDVVGPALRLVAPGGGDDVGLAPQVAHERLARGR